MTWAKTDRCENKANVVPAERVTLHLGTCERKRRVQRCLFANRLSFSELFDDISLMLNVRGLCVIVDSLISATKVCDCDFHMVLTGM